jgi:hypothetical protein
VNAEGSSCTTSSGAPRFAAMARESEVGPFDFDDTVQE